MLIDFSTILKDHPCIYSVEDITEKAQSGNLQTNKIFRLHAHNNGYDWKLIISISHLFPLQLPIISIENTKDYPAMGHISWDGSVCYMDTQGLVVDYRKPENILTACVYEALRTLHENYTDPKKTELHKDFKSYWE